MGLKPSEIQKDTWRSFLIAHARVTREIDRRLKADGHIPLDIYDVLVTLEFEPTEKLRMSELADRIVFSRSGLTRLIDRLEKQGYVKREACEDDRRGSYAVLTEKGKAARVKAWRTFEPAIQELWGDFIADEEAMRLKPVYDAMTLKAIRSGR